MRNMKNKHKVILIVFSIFLAIVLVLVTLFWNPETLFLDEKINTSYEESLVFINEPSERLPLTEVDYYIEDIEIEDHQEFERIKISIFPMLERYLIGFVADQKENQLDLLLINLNNQKDGKTLFEEGIKLTGGIIKELSLTFPERDMGLINLELDNKRPYRVTGENNAILIDIEKTGN